MRILKLIFFGVLIQSCTITDRGIQVDFPHTQPANVCLNAVSDDEIVVIKAKIDRETYKDEKLRRAKFQAKDRCFLSRQVVDIMGSFTYESDKLEIAQFLYTKTDDKHNYDNVADDLTYKSDRDKLWDYINSM